MMKICSIRIKGFQQFDDLYLDFTNPETGEPVDKVCFIGPSGTGKSTLLDFINSFHDSFGISNNSSPNAFLVKLKLNSEKIFFPKLNYPAASVVRRNVVIKKTTLSCNLRSLTSMQNIIYGFTDTL